MVLIVEPLDPEVMQWLVARHPVRYAPDLARDLAGLRQALRKVRAVTRRPPVRWRCSASSDGTFKIYNRTIYI